MVKNTRVGGIRENAVLQIRAEFFNAFNHAQFGNPGTAVSSPATFGVITSDTVNPRLIQFAMKYQFLRGRYLRHSRPALREALLLARLGFIVARPRVVGYKV